MLRVTVELIPGGWEAAKRVLARAEIGNISSLADTSDYAVRVAEGRNPLTGTEPWQREGKIFAHDRRASVWSLVAKVAAWAAAEAERS